MANTQRKSTVFVVDDDASIRKSLTRLLCSMGFDVETFASAGEFLARGPYGGIGCIILDIRMPGLSGMDLQDELAKGDYCMPIIFITGHGDIPVSVQAMKKGAVDFFAKPFNDEDLQRAVSDALRRDGEAKARRADLQDIRQRMERLTPREHDVLRHVIAGELNKQIAFKLGITEKTVKVHRGHIVEKLGVGSVAEIVRLAGKLGVIPSE